MNMELEFGYGTGVQRVSVPGDNLIGILHANRSTPCVQGVDPVAAALDAPIGAPDLGEVVRPGEKIVIITSDITRPCPTAKILSPLLHKMRSVGVREEDITLVFALGSHRHHTREEMQMLAGDAFRHIRCVDSNPEDCLRLGMTTRGTPVDITRIVAEADRRICLGNIEYHYFAGYSGGAKAIMPGVSSRAAIQANHRMMTNMKCRAGVLEGNPIREDIEEAAFFCKIDYIINVVLDEHKQIIYASAGHHIEAHRAGCRFLDGIYRKELSEKADIVLVSQGGFPKDLNLYQTQKALDNAKYAVKDGGIIILLGSCREGMGEACFQRWMKEAEKAEDLLSRVQVRFELGGHKAAAIAMVLNRARLFLVSEMDPQTVKECFLEPYHSAQEALDEALCQLGPNATILAMPYGGSTLPVVLEGE